MSHLITFKKYIGLYHICSFLLHDLVTLVRCCFCSIFCCRYLTLNIFTPHFRFPKWTKQLVTKILFHIWKKHKISDKLINEALGY